jgi:SAM-dependent methyltransferase
MKFKKINDEYISQRKEFSIKYGKRDVWEVIDQWPLYVGNFNLQRVLAVYELLKTTLKVPGHIAEFGSWKGSNVMFMAKVLNMIDPFSNKLVYSFDSFEGLTQFHEKDNEAVSLKGAYRGNLEELTDLIKLNKLDDNIRIQKGYIENTLPSLLEEDSSLSFSMVYIDTDLYTSSKIILESLHSRLMKGGIFVFDEWNYPQWPGETIAAREFLNEHGSNYEVIHIQNTRQPTLVLKKMV